MKKILLVILSAFLINDAFSQNSDTRFENRKTNGYYNLTQIALLMGNYNFGGYYTAPRADFQIAPSLTMTNGYMFNEKVAAGIGVGYEIFDRNLFPVFLDIRRTVWDNKVSPFFAVKTGYAFSGFKEIYYDWGTKIKKYGGFMFNPEMGVKAPLSADADLLFTVAYRHQKTKSIGRTHNSSQIWEQEASMNRISFGIAIMFR